jgi:hypothetical protein
MKTLLRIIARCNDHLHFLHGDITRIHNFKIKHDGRINSKQNIGTGRLQESI